jgi:peptide/nickel transport system substrate-binding protein
MPRTRTWKLTACVAVVFAMFSSACTSGTNTPSGQANATPTPGGKVVYGLEAETSDGWCLPESQLAISGITVANALYDTLTRPDAKGEVQPWLAKSVEHNTDSTQWTITLRDGVQFHDGSKLTAEVVKNNIDAYRGAYPTRKPLLFTFLFNPVKEVTVTGPLTVQVTLKQPWVAFADALWGNGRIGILAQSQLDDTSSCATKPIGTGPFSLVTWTPGQSLVAKKNPNYWGKDAAGRQLPYLDEIEFRPIVENSQRVNALESGEINAMHTSDAATIEDAVAKAAKGDINAYETTKFSDVIYMLFNVSQAPFDNLTARKAVAQAINWDEYNSILGAGKLSKATGPFSPGNMGYLDNAGYPASDLNQAKSLAADYEKQTGKKLSFSYLAVNSETTLAQAQLLQAQMAKAGIDMQITSVDQATQISAAIAGKFQALQWRNHPGSDPDQQYIWWRTGSPLNFGRINDADLNGLLDQARSTNDGRAAAYEKVNRIFGEKVYNAWLNYSHWMVATAANVHGVPGEGPTAAEGFPALASGHLVAYMWIGK